MPVQDGLETIIKLRQVDPAIKVIAMTGGGQTGTLDFLSVATLLGAQRTLRKPFSQHELLAVMRELT